MTLPCGCCEGASGATPDPIPNAPGLTALSYRVGTYASFFDAMKRRLSGSDAPELQALTTREASDPSIALLDAWAIVGDVLTFYQERIANEGYLGTATERRSVLELARLIGYDPRPGVAASVSLAFTIEQGSAPVVIPRASRVASVPDPGEQMQTFETSDPLAARYAWNEMQPRLFQAQTASSIRDGNRVYVRGITTQVKPNDALLIDYADGKPLQPRRVTNVTTLTNLTGDLTDPNNEMTCIEFTNWPTATMTPADVSALAVYYSNLKRFDVAPGKTANEVVDMLGELKKVADTLPVDRVHDFILQKAIPIVTERAEQAEHANATKLAPWLRSLEKTLQSASNTLSLAPVSAAAVPAKPITTQAFFNSLTKAAAINPRSSAALERDPAQTYSSGGDIAPRLLTKLRPAWQDVLYPALRNGVSTPSSNIKVYVMRRTAALFGNAVPREPQYETRDGDNPRAGLPLPQDQWPEWKLAADEAPDKAFLDAQYDDVRAGGYVILQAPVASANGRFDPEVRTIKDALTLSRTAYGTSLKTTRLTVDTPWWNPARDAARDTAFDDFSVIRGTTVFCQSELLPLALEPIEDELCGSEIELDDLFDGLEAGRWVIVSGDRADLPALKGEKGESVPGLQSAELAMLSGVRHGFRAPDGSIQEIPQLSVRGEAGQRPDESVHTFITLADELAYCYRRDTVKVFGNVVRGTHGETRKEILGAGDATQSLQRFDLKQSPLTYVSSATPSGAASTLQVRVNEVLWHEAPSLAALSPGDRGYLTMRADDDKVSVIFGTGDRGARLPIGRDNVTATYRQGIGKAGNVRAGQISLLTDRPLGVKDVINPIRSSGGADRESRDQARTNAPTAVLSLDRLVSVSDYANFSRSFAGIGKATAAHLTDGHRDVVSVTIAGVDDIPIDETSDLFVNLKSALTQYGDPALPVRLMLRTRLALVMSVNVKVAADYDWEFVEPRVRAALLQTFGFDAVNLGTTLYLSKALQVAQGVPGVEYVDVDVFDVLSEEDLTRLLFADSEFSLSLRTRIDVKPSQFNGATVDAAEIAYLDANVPDTLILREVAS
jgi:hypothetical protein